VTADILRFHPWLIAMITFFVVLFSGLHLTKSVVDEERFLERDHLYQSAHIFASAFEREVRAITSLAENLHVQYKLLGPEQFSTSFSTLVSDIKHSSPPTEAMVLLAPEGRISQAYPDAALLPVAQDMMQSPERESIERAIATGLVLSLAEIPLSAEQVLLAHYPIFQVNEQAFWGVITVMLPLESLLQQANLTQLHQHTVVLKRTLADGHEQNFFRTAIPDKAAVRVEHDLDLPDGDWVLQLSTVQNSHVTWGWLGLIGMVATLLALIAHRLSTQPQQLRAEVAARTAELAARDKFLNDLINSLPVGIVVTDTEAGIRYSNPVFNRIIPQPIAEGTSLITLLQQTLDNTNMEQFLLSRIGREEVSVEVMVQIGTQEFLLTCSRIIGVQGSFLVWVFRDITEISHINRSLRSVSTLRAEMLRLIPDPMAFFDKEGELIERNPGFQTLFSSLVDVEAGFSCKEFEQQLMASTRQPEKLRPVYALSPTTQQQLHVDTFIFSTHPQKVFERTVCIDSSSSTVGCIMHFRDVTDAHEVDRMKTEFLSTAAHELRTPLANIFGYTELLIKADFDASRQKSMLDIIYNQTRRLSKIIDDLLDLARIESRAGETFKFDTHNLSQLVENVLNKMALELETRPLKFYQEGDDLQLWCDAEKIEQVIENLLSNAIKYSAEATPVSLSVYVKTREGRQGIILYLKDQGIGMSQDDLEHVFERFYRADGSGKIPGTGLGMAIVKEIISHHHGWIDIESKEDVGTTVTVWLPQH
jgi:nitrogen-specific signal transduction histidine kinase/sensor domain CHASE-containing protein